MTFKTFHGAWPALLTPTAPDGGVNVAMLREITEYLLGKGIGGLYLCGSTGEGVLMAVDERRQVAEAVLEQVAGRVPVIVHVGAAATRYAVQLAQHAADVGADGVASILPSFRRGIDDVYRHYETIAAAVPELPFLPYLFGGEVDALTLMRTLLDRVPNVAGAKYTGPDMYELHAIVELRDTGWSIFSGMDQQCLFAAMFGAPANIGSTLNLMPGAYCEIRACCERGDLVRARDLQVQVNRVTRVLHQFGTFGAIFQGMRLLGFDCGEPRLPNPALDPARRDAFHQAMADANFEALAAM
jgi:N-acetylneuraminate lyase